MTKPTDRPTLRRYLAQFSGVAPRRRGRIRVRPAPWYLTPSGVVVAFKGAMVERMNVEQFKQGLPTVNDGMALSQAVIDAGFWLDELRQASNERLDDLFGDNEGVHDEP